MAATIATAIGYDKTRSKITTRLGSQASEARADTYRTFTTVFIRRDGSGYVEVRRDGKTIHSFEFDKES